MSTRHRDKGKKRRVHVSTGISAYHTMHCFLGHKSQPVEVMKLWGQKVLVAWLIVGEDNLCGSSLTRGAWGPVRTWSGGWTGQRLLCSPKPLGTPHPASPDLTWSQARSPDVQAPRKHQSYTPFLQRQMKHLYSEDESVTHGFHRWPQSALPTHDCSFLFQSHQGAQLRHPWTGSRQEQARTDREVEDRSACAHSRGARSKWAFQGLVGRTVIAMSCWLPGLVCVPSPTRQLWSYTN